MAQGLNDAPIVRSGYGCNNACRFCDQADLRVTEGDLPDDVVAAAAREAGRSASAGRGVVVLSGGEITLRQGLPDWVRGAREAGARRVIVQTNGRRLAYASYCQGLVEAGVDVFAVALHGHVAALHDWITRVDGSFEQALMGMRNVRKAGATLLVNTVVTRPGFRHLPEIAALSARLGARQLRILWPRELGDAARLRPSVVPSRDLSLPYVERAVQLAERAGLRVAVDVGDPTRTSSPSPEHPNVLAARDA